MTAVARATAVGTATTQDALLDAAEELFARFGYASVGIREIAEKAKANIAAIKYHFGSKSELYLAAVRRAMSRSEAAGAWDALRDYDEAVDQHGDARDPDAAAIALTRFVRLMLERIMNEAAGDEPRCCSLMLREAAEPSEAIDAVVRDFIEPHHRMLMNVLSAVMAGSGKPGGEHEIGRAMADDELSASATSVMSQILHRRVFRPFLERMPQTAAHVHDLDYAAHHIARFSLRGIGFDQTRIDAAIAAGMTCDSIDQTDQRRSKARSTTSTDP